MTRTLFPNQSMGPRPYIYATRYSGRRPYLEIRYLQDFQMLTPCPSTGVNVHWLGASVRHTGYLPTCEPLQDSLLFGRRYYSRPRDAEETASINGRHS